MQEPNVPLLGEYVSTDALRAFVYECLKLDGTPFDLTGYTVKLQGRSRDWQGSKIDLAGTLTGTPTDGLATFAPIGTSLPLRSGKRRELYVCRVVATRVADSKPTFSDPFALAVAAPPL